MINDWRSKFSTRSQTDKLFPFGFVQISVWEDKNNATCPAAWSQCTGVAQVRWGLTGNKGYVPNENLPNVFMAVSTDLGDPGYVFFFFVDISALYSRNV